MIIFIALALISSIMIITVVRGGNIKFLGLTINSTSSINDTISGINKNVFHEELLKDSSLLAISDLTKISKKYFKAGITKDNALEVIKNLVGKSGTIDSYETKFSYKLFMLEIIIHEAGGYIDVRNTESSGNKKTFEMIQTVLKEINQYDEQIDGDQQRTYEALRKFKIHYNNLLNNPKARFI